MGGAEPYYDSLPNIGLFSHVFLCIPAKSPNLVRLKIRDYLFNLRGKELFNEKILSEIVGAAQADILKEFPSAEQAALYFEEMISWRSEVSNESVAMLKIRGNSNKRVSELIGRALSFSIVPSLDRSMMTSENLDKLLAFYDQVQAPDVLVSLPYFATARNEFSIQAEKIIRQALQDKQQRKVAYASFALLKWKELEDSQATIRLTSRAIYLIGSGRMTGLSSLLWVAREMYSQDLLSSSDVESLTESIPIIFDNLDYQHFPPSSEEAISASLVRAECVRLSKTILSKNSDASEELHRVLNEAKNDALPEVRFANEL